MRYIIIYLLVLANIAVMVGCDKFTASNISVSDAEQKLRTQLLLSDKLCGFDQKYAEIQGVSCTDRSCEGKKCIVMCKVTLVSTKQVGKDSMMGFCIQKYHLTDGTFWQVGRPWTTREAKFVFSKFDSGWKFEDVE